MTDNKAYPGMKLFWILQIARKSETYKDGLELLLKNSESHVREGLNYFSYLALAARDQLELFAKECSPEQLSDYQADYWLFCTEVAPFMYEHLQNRNLFQDTYMAFECMEAPDLGIGKWSAIMDADACMKSLLAKKPVKLLGPG